MQANVPACMQALAALVIIKKKGGDCVPTHMHACVWEQGPGCPRTMVRAQRDPPAHAQCMGSMDPVETESIKKSLIVFLVFLIKRDYEIS